MVYKLFSSIYCSPTGSVYTWSHFLQASKFRWMCVQYVIIILTVCVYLYSCMCPENAAKLRIALVKAHGLQMLTSLQSRVKQTLSSMRKWAEEQYHAETKRYSMRIFMCILFWNVLEGLIVLFLLSVSF